MSGQDAAQERRIDEPTAWADSSTSARDATLRLAQVEQGDPRAAQQLGPLARAWLCDRLSRAGGSSNSGEIS